MVWEEKALVEFLAVRMQQQGIEKLEAKHAAAHLYEFITQVVNAEVAPYQATIEDLQLQLAVATVHLEEAQANQAPRDVLDMS